MAENEDIRVLILTGAGDKAFIAGADITELATFGPLQAKTFAQKGQAVVSKLQALAIPVIAAVNGFALGGGSEMALACDFIYASENANFGLPEISLGIIPGFGGTQRLPRLIGANLAKEMIFTGKMIPAAEAREVGMVKPGFRSGNPDGRGPQNRPDHRFQGESIPQGGQTERQPRPQCRPHATGIDIECEAFALCMASEDAKEGTSAFLEKRKAAFKGRIK